LVVAARFGIGKQVDAFFLALSIPTAVLSVLPSLSQTVLVPVFSGLLHTNGKLAAWKVANPIINCGALGLSVIALGGLGISPQIIAIIAPGFEASTKALAAQMLMLLMLLILPMGLFEIMGTMLISLGRFAAPASMLFIRYAVATTVVSLSDNVVNAAGGLLLGATLQGIPMILVLASQGFRYSFSVCVDNPDVNRAARMAIWPSLGLLARQCNMVFERSIASLLPSGSVAALSYAYQLISLVDRVVSQSVFIAAFPALSRASASSDSHPTRRTLLPAIRLSSFVTFPAMVGLMVLSVPVARILFEHGEVEYGSVSLMSSLLLIYSLSIPFQAMVYLLLAPHYASLDTRTPAFHMMIIAVTNAVLDIALVVSLRIYGLALAYSLTYIVSALRAGRLIRKDITPVKLELSQALSKTLGASLVMGASVWALHRCIESFTGVSSPFTLVLTTVGLCMVGSLVYIVVARLLRVEEVATAVQLIRSLVFLR
jgi:putative peptidoglycan lipid II flippase